MDTLKSAFFRLDKNDLVKGLIMAFLVPIIGMLATAMNVPGFSFFSFDFSTALKIGLSAMLAYLAKNLLTTSDGKFLGVVGN